MKIGCPVHAQQERNRVRDNSTTADTKNCVWAVSLVWHTYSRGGKKIYNIRRYGGSFVLVYRISRWCLFDSHQLLAHRESVWSEKKMGTEQESKKYICMHDERKGASVAVSENDLAYIRHDNYDFMEWWKREEALYYISELMLYRWVYINFFYFYFILYFFSLVHSSWVSIIISSLRKSFVRSVVHICSSLFTSHTQIVDEEEATATAMAKK